MTIIVIDNELLIFFLHALGFLKDECGMQECKEFCTELNCTVSQGEYPYNE